MIIKKVEYFGEHLRDWFEQITLKQTFLFSIIFIILIGFSYFSLSIISNGLLYQGKPLLLNLEGFFLAEYFSFTMLVSQGFGDLYPLGLSRLIAGIEAVAGWLLFGIIVSKIVGVKQERILEEVYALSFEEKVNRLRSTLFLFRRDAKIIIERISEGHASMHELKNVWPTLSTFDVALIDALKLLYSPTSNNTKMKYARTIDNHHLELLLDSIERSLNRAVQLISVLNKHKVSWKENSVVMKLASIRENIQKVIELSRDRNGSIAERIPAIEKLLTEMKV